MRKSEYLAQKNDRHLPKSCVNLFCQIIKNLGFEPNECLTEKDDLFVSVEHQMEIWGDYEKLKGQEKIDLYRQRRDECDLFVHYFTLFVCESEAHFADFINPDTGAFFTRNELDDLVQDFMCQFVPYDECERSYEKVTLKGQWCVVKNKPWKEKDIKVMWTDWSIELSDTIHVCIEEAMLSVICKWLRRYVSFLKDNTNRDMQSFLAYIDMYMNTDYATYKPQFTIARKRNRPLPYEHSEARNSFSYYKFNLKRHAYIQQTETSFYESTNEWWYANNVRVWYRRCDNWPDSQFLIKCWKKDKEDYESTLEWVRNYTLHKAVKLRAWRIKICSILNKLSAFFKF